MIAGVNGTARILIADDDADILSLIAFHLKRRGHEVLPANDGDAALRIARAEIPDLAVLDGMMPGLTGFDVLRELRADETTKEIPVILLTAYVQEADLVRGLELGADEYITKPFSPQELLARIGALLGSGTIAMKAG